MKKHIFVYIIACFFLSMSCVAQDDRVDLGRSYKSKELTIPVFIKKINENNDKAAFMKGITKKLLGKETDILKIEGDFGQYNNVYLTFTTNILKGNGTSGVKVISIETLKEELNDEKNEKFKKALTAILTLSVEPKVKSITEGSTDSVKIVEKANTRSKTSEQDSTAFYKNKVVQLNKDIEQRQKNQNWFLFGSFLLGLLISYGAYRYWLKERLKKYEKSNPHESIKSYEDVSEAVRKYNKNPGESKTGFPPETHDKEIITKWQKATNHNTPEEYTEAQNAPIIDSPPNEIIETGAIIENQSTNIYYFDSGNLTDSDKIGFFKDANKYTPKSQDTTYKIEVNANNPHEAKFWFEANHSLTIKAAIGYRSIKVEPFCENINEFQNQANVITKEPGLISLNGNMEWVVKQKAKIRYA